MISRVRYSSPVWSAIGPLRRGHRRLANRVSFAGILTGNFWLLQALAAGMTAYGIYVCYLMLRKPEELAIDANHVSWAHMYRMMFVAQVGFAVAYLI